jgi:hypothetical protein
MSRRFLTLAFVLPVLLSSNLYAVEPIVKIDGVRPNKSVFKESSATKPLVLRSAEDAGKHFDEENLGRLKKKVDFTKQLVLVFAWRGSGQDKLNYSVAESYPEQIFFTYKRGRTRDLRPHVYVFALRSNVTWKAK